MSKPSRVRVKGPLEPYVAGFRGELARQGYSPGSATGHLQLMAHLSRWLADRGRDPDELSVRDVEQFLSDRRAAGRVHRRLTARGIAPLLGYLQGLGMGPEPPLPVADGPLDQLLKAFIRYLIAERGLAASTVSNYSRVAAQFLAGRCRERDPDGLGSLSADEVSAFVLAEAARHSAGSLNNVTTALRALLRFLYVESHTPTSLVEAVLAAPGWRDRGIVRAVEATAVARLLASCDRRTAAGRRDFAILTVLTRLGLRAGEVAALTVDDLDWQAGEILVTGKGNRRERLPLPVDVGQSIADYCRRGRRRPTGRGRNLFLHVRAPYGALSNTGINQVVSRACDRALWFNLR